MKPRVYFDAADEALDGMGWNVVDADDEGGVAARFATEEEALRFAHGLQAMAIGMDDEEEAS